MPCWPASVVSHSVRYIRGRTRLIRQMKCVRKWESERNKLLEMLRSVMCQYAVIRRTQGWWEAEGLVFFFFPKVPESRPDWQLHQFPFTHASVSQRFSTRGSPCPRYVTHLQTRSVDGHYRPWALCGAQKGFLFLPLCASIWVKLLRVSSSLRLLWCCSAPTGGKVEQDDISLLQLKRRDHRDSELEFHNVKGCRRSKGM